MRLLNLKSFFAVLIMSAFIFTACDDTNNPVDPSGSPKITSISNPVGIIGQLITIYGTDFGDDFDNGDVKFGTVIPQASELESWTSTEIKVRVPAAAAIGDTKITVVVNGNASNEFSFTVAPADPQPPAMLYATSINNTTVRIKWDGPANGTENWTLFDGYTLKVTDESNATVLDTTIAKGMSAFDIANLTEGVIYKFLMKTRYTNASVGTTGAEIMWSPASRWNEINDQTIRVYESASSFGSGLDLMDGTTEAPKIWTIAFKEEWDLALNNKDGAMKFGPAAYVGYTSITPGDVKACEVSDAYFTENDLNSVLADAALNDQRDDKGTLIPFSTVAYDLEGDVNLNGKSGAIFLVRVAETPGNWNYAKVMVKNTGSQWLQGTAPDRYIEVEISYQSKANVPYAKFPAL